MKLWDVGTRQERVTLKGQRSAAFSPDGKTLATGGGDNTVKLWDVRTWQELVTLKGHTSVISLVFSPNGRILMTGGQIDAQPVGYCFSARTGNV